MNVEEVSDRAAISLCPKLDSVEKVSDRAAIPLCPQSDSVEEVSDRASISLCPQLYVSRGDAGQCCYFIVSSINREKAIANAV